MSNQNLFFYGLWAKTVQLIGVFIATLSLFGFTIHWVLGLLMLIAGLIIILKGKAMRFDFQRSSGSIIHRGDW